MSEKLIITYDESMSDAPVLVVAKEDNNFFFEPRFTIVNVLTGDKAVETYNQLRRNKNENPDSNTNV